LIILMLEIINTAGVKIDTKFLKNVERAAVAVLGKKGLENISLVLVGDAKMRSLNRRYRAKNSVTDVLSFEELNEIFICWPQAKRQAKALKIPLNRELTRLLAHGIVHLKGYDHERSNRAAREALDLENKILAKI